MSALTRAVHEDQIQHELEHQEPHKPDDGNVQQGRVLASRGIGIDDNGSSQSNDEDDPVSDGGKDAPLGGKFLPAVETKPFLNEAHGHWLAFIYLIPFHGRWRKTRIALQRLRLSQVSHCD